MATKIQNMKRERMLSCELKTEGFCSQVIQRISSAKVCSFLRFEALSNRELPVPENIFFLI
jgi:hypothetical protein